MESPACLLFMIMGFCMSFMSIMMHDQMLNLLTNFSFMEMNSTQFSINISCDWKFLSLGAIICIITSNIILYSKTYMNSDKFKIRFIIILSMFASSMLWTIISSKNILTMLVGWDFLGLTSLLLIMHYQSNYVYSNSMLTFILNRLGDIAFIIASAFMLSSGSWSFYCMLDNKMMIFSIMSIAAFTKSAQLPFSAWLPKAMAAPTPVSSLVHSSTLVTAGVILLMSMEPLIKNSSCNFLLLTISIFTMLVSSVAGCLSFDLKKIIAFSTMSQISFMMMILIMGSMELAFLHLLIHAMFKSLMFMAAGTIIHHSGGEQDIRKISNMKLTLPLESIMMSLSLMALMGLPFLSGFYSKDLIIEYYSNNLHSLLLSMTLDFCMCLTSFYSFRIIMCIISKSVSMNNLLNWKTSIYEKMVMIIFFLPIITVGSILSWIFIKTWSIDFPMNSIKKSFGLWCLLFTITMIFSLTKMKILYTPKWDMFRSISYLNNLMNFISYKTLILSFYCNNYYENMWNKFLTINLIMNYKMILKPEIKKFNPWLMIQFSLFNITVISIIINY